MKSFWKKNKGWIIPTLVVVVVIALYHYGFRITYDPNLITDWDATAAMASWAGVVASFIAIWYAIQVPRKIADRQDKIALFEKRHSLYYEYRKIFAYALWIVDVDKSHYYERHLKLVEIAFQKKIKEYDQFQEFLHREGEMLHQLAMVFPEVEYHDYSEFLQAVLDHFKNAAIGKIPTDTELQDFKNMVVAFDRKYGALFESYLAIK